MKATSKSKKAFKTIIKWSIIIISILLVIAFVIMIIGGMFVSPDYLDPWDKKNHKIVRDPRIQLLAIGILAPNVHNMQNWKFKLDDQDDKVFYLYANPERTISFDPTHREMMISCGTLLEYVNIAAKKQNFGVEIKLFPNGLIDEENFEKSVETVPVAKVTLNDDVDLKRLELYDKMFIQDTNRYEYLKTSISKAEKDLYYSLNDFDDLNIKFLTDEEALKNISELALKGLDITHKVPRLASETKKITRMTEFQKNKKAYGVSLETQGIKNLFMKYAIQGTLTIMPFLRSNKNMAKVTQKTYKKLYDSTGTYMVLVSPVAKMNDRITQVNCGRLYSRLVLTGHTLKTGFHPMSALIAEYEEAVQVKGEFLTKHLSADEYPFMTTRVGLIIKPFPKSMRQNVLDFVK